MKTSEATDMIYPAICEMQSELLPIVRDKVVKTGKYEFKYAPLDSVMAMLKPLMTANKLGLLQAVDQDVLTTRVIHVSGQWIESETHLNRDHANMQGFGGEVTYKRRYALCALVGIVSDDDNDAPVQKSAGMRHSARGGIGADLPDDWKIYLGDLADECTTLVNRGRTKDAVDKINEANLEADQRIFLEDQMDSKTRSSLKEITRPKNG